MGFTPAADITTYGMSMIKVTIIMHVPMISPEYAEENW
jgi:hypothetical protein